MLCCLWPFEMCSYNSSNYVLQRCIQMIWVSSASLYHNNRNSTTLSVMAIRVCVCLCGCAYQTFTHIPNDSCKSYIMFCHLQFIHLIEHNYLRSSGRMVFRRSFVKYWWIRSHRIASGSNQYTETNTHPKQSSKINPRNVVTQTKRPCHGGLSSYHIKKLMEKSNAKSKPLPKDSINSFA